MYRVSRFHRAAVLVAVLVFIYWWIYILGTQPNVMDASVLTTTTKKQTPQAISLFVRIASDRKYLARFYCFLLKTTVLFWPSYLGGKIVIVLDKESQETNDVFVDQLKNVSKHFPRYNIFVKYEALPNDTKVLDIPKARRGSGYNRQLWSSFFIDLYIEDEIVAWMDTDSPFAAPVTRSTVFNGRRLRAFGIACGPAVISEIPMWKKSTERAIGLPWPADFMVYFPVYIYRDTFTRCREYLLERFQTTNFDEAFKQFYNSVIYHMSPVSVVMTYAWYFERDRYDWNIRVDCEITSYNQRFPKGTALLPNDTKPIFSMPQTAYHFSSQDVESPSMQERSLSYVRQTSFCLTQQASGNNPEICREYNVTSKITDMFMLYKHDLEASHFRKEQTLCQGKWRDYCVRMLLDYIREIGEEIREKKRVCDWEDFVIAGKLAEGFGFKCAAASP